MSLFPNLLDFSLKSRQYWMDVGGKLTCEKLASFCEAREDAFQLNLPLTLSAEHNVSLDESAVQLCRGILRNYEAFLSRYGEKNNAKKKILEIFQSDWNCQNTVFLSTLAEVCVVEVLSTKNNFKLIKFDSSLGPSKKRKKPQKC